MRQNATRVCIPQELHNWSRRLRAEWAEGLEPPNSGIKDSIWYTDGSKMASGTGAGIYANDYNSSVSMGRLATVFQAETYAITACAQENIDRRTRDRAIYIYTQWQSSGPEGTYSA
jgi:hypothetical protein